MAFYRAKGGVFKWLPAGMDGKHGEQVGRVFRQLVCRVLFMQEIGRGKRGIGDYASGEETWVQLVSKWGGCLGKQVDGKYMQMDEGSWDMTWRG